MYAIVKTGGKQYRVEKGDSIVVDRLHEDEGAKVALDPLLFVDGDKSVFEGADLDKIKVEAVVQGHERGPKIRVLKYKPKRGYKRRTGHRSELTRLEIGDIKLLSRRAGGAKAAQAEQAEVKAEPKGQERAEPKVQAKAEPTAEPKKPAAKRPAARRPAA